MATPATPLPAVEEKTTPPPQPPRRTVSLAGREVEVVLPKRGDPRLKLAAVIITLQVLGQTVLGFKVSIAQILISIGVCAAIDVAVTLKREAKLVWPGSAMLTGNSIGFILRASGTQHGDWWSLNGIWYFVLAAVLSMLSKYLIRPQGRHIFNPSNVGLVWTLLVIGPAHVFPQYLWWGPAGPAVVAALVVILVGAVWVLRSVRMVPMAVGFMVPFAILVGIFAASGRSFFAIWHDGAISGMSYWTNIVTSPEVLIFVFFMMSDPQTAPKRRAGRIAYGAGTALVAAGLLYFQPTEFGIKVAILSSLTFMCALVPIIESVLARRARASDGPVVEAPARSFWSAARNPAVIAAAIIAVAAPLDAASLAGEKEIVYIERGLTGKNPQ